MCEETWVTWIWVCQVAHLCRCLTPTGSITMGCLSITGYPAWNDQEHCYSPMDEMLVHHMHRIPSMKWDGSPSQGIQHEATRSIAISPWMRCWSACTGCLAWSEMVVHHKIPSMKWPGACYFLMDEMLVHHMHRIPSMKWDGSPSQGTHRSELLTSMKWPGARFSKAPKTFRAYEAIFNSLYLENKEACRHKTLHEGQLYSCSKYVKRTAL